MIKSVNTYYTDPETLEKFVQSQEFFKQPNLLIQVFTAFNDEQYISSLLQQISSLLPDAEIIGSTTDGEISNGKVLTGKTVLSFTGFESTSLKVFSVEHQDKGFLSGKRLAEALIENDTKLLIAFADGLSTHGEEFLDGIACVNKEVSVAGGLAGDYNKFTKTLVFTKERILSHGAVGVALNGKKLQSHRGYSFNWYPIGAELVITQAKGNRLYTINGEKAVDIYKHYLGDKLAEGLPSIGIEFPLIVNRNGKKMARALISVKEDGSFLVAGNLFTGEKVCIGFGDREEILRASCHIIRNTAKKPSEAIFIYSCMTRRYFMGSDVESETLPFQQIAPVAGFFTHGEFFSSDKNELFNQTLTFVSLSESNKVRDIHLKVRNGKTDIHSISMNGLIHLVNTTSKELKKHTKALQISSEKESILRSKYSHQAQIIEQMHESVISTDIFGNIVSWNRGSEELLGYKAEEMIGQHVSKLYLPEDYTSCQENLEILRVKNEHKVQTRMVKKSKEIIVAELSLSLLKDAEGNPSGMVSYIQNITERKKAEEALNYLAHYDTLTKLPNRVLFHDRLEQGIEKAKRHESILALFFIDLDRFKQINDSFGHEMGDKVLKTVANRLSGTIRHEDTLARLGGDEFLLIMEDLKKPQDAIVLARKLLKVLIEPIVIHKNTLYVSSSIGISLYPQDSTYADDLLKYADTAMYKAKEEGRNNFQFYESELTQQAMERIQMKTSLLQAIENEEFVIYYQPQIDTLTNKIIGLEALIRWDHPTKGLVLPSSFIPIAEENGLIIEIDRWVMKNAMKQVSLWYREGLISDTLALNLTIKQLEGKDFLNTVQENFETYSFKPEWLELEITESQMMRKHEETILKLNELNKLGIKISIDDFGTGYSSLSFLNRLPINKIKIDYSFIKDIPEKEESIAIVKTIIALAQSLRLDVVAEGVETEKQKYFLQAMGCKYMQGHYFSHPLPEEEVKKLLSKEKW